MVGQAGCRAAVQHIAVAAGTQNRRYDQVTDGRHDCPRETGQAGDDLFGLCETGLPALQQRSAEQHVVLQHSRLGKKSYVVTSALRANCCRI